MRHIKVITSTILAMALATFISARIAAHTLMELIDIFGSESGVPMLIGTTLISVVPFLIGAALLNVYLQCNKRRIQRLKDRH